jgi:hypothetical protein
MKHSTFQKAAFCTLAVGVLATSQSVLAHTNLTKRTVEEGTTVYNDAAVGHGCGDAPVIANSVVFPDGTDSIVSIAGVVVEGASVFDYIEGVPAIKKVISNAAFKKSAVAHGRADKVVGIHSWSGSVAAHDTVGLVSMMIGGVKIIDESCAKSVTFKVAVADICKITRVAGFNDTSVNFWTPKVGSNFDRADGQSEPTSLTITRTSSSPLPAQDVKGNACGQGVDVVVTPSADQLNHDMPIPRVWPKK